jgi:outer membrane protein TolC
MLLGVVLASAGCTAGVFDNDRSSWRPAPERVERIEATDLVSRSLVEPVSHETEVEDLLAGGIPLPALDTTTPLLLAEVRRATLEHNLELRVEVISPSIAGASASAEEAKFEAVFLAGYDRNSTNLFTDLEGGDPTTQDSLLTGFKFPLASGGMLNVDTIAAKADAGTAGGAIGPWQSSLNFSISQPLLRGAGVRANTASILIANWNKDIADARLKLAAIRLLSDADKAYWTLYAAWRELEVRKSNFDLARAQYERAQRRLDAGDAPELDVIRAQSGIGRSLEAIISADAALRRAQRRIKKIMNRPEYPIGGAAMFEPVTKPNPLKLELDGATLAREAVEERMEMLELELQLAVDAATIDLRRNQTLPAFALSYTYSILGNATSVQGAYQDLGDDDAYSVGVSGEVPIGNDAARYNLQAAVLARVQRLATRAARKQAIEGEVFDALDSLRASWQSILAARLETLLAARTLEGEQRQFNVGIRTSTDVLDAASRLADAQSREVRALADYQIALVDIAFATGTLLGHSHLRFDDDAQRFLESD